MIAGNVHMKNVVKNLPLPNDTEHNFCKSKGWYRIYDCGTKVYKWKKHSN